MRHARRSPCRSNRYAPSPIPWRRFAFSKIGSGRPQWKVLRRLRPRPTRTRTDLPGGITAPCGTCSGAARSRAPTSPQPDRTDRIVVLDPDPLPVRIEAVTAARVPPDPQGERARLPRPAAAGVRVPDPPPGARRELRELRVPLVPGPLPAVGIPQAVALADEHRARVVPAAAPAEGDRAPQPPAPTTRDAVPVAGGEPDPAALVARALDRSSSRSAAARAWQAPRRPRPRGCSSGAPSPARRSGGRRGAPTSGRSA